MNGTWLKNEKITLRSPEPEDLELMYTMENDTTLWSVGNATLPYSRYTISFNGKARFTMDFATEASREEIEAAVIANEQSQKYIDGKSIKKVIVVPKKIVNIVIG